MLRRTLAAATAVVLAASQSGGCGSSNSGSGSGGSGHGAGPLTCLLDLQFTGPVTRQLTATVNVTCTFPVTSSRTTLTIQQRPAGGDAMSWHRYDDPKTTAQVPPVSLAYIAHCSSGQWEAVATIDGVGPAGQPFHSSATEALPAPLTDADCAS